MTSTTTCEFFEPWITRNTGSGGNPSSIQKPTANNQNFQWGTSTCVTITDESASTTYLTGDAQMQLYAFAIAIFIALLFFFKDIFDVKRYD